MSNSSTRRTFTLRALATMASTSPGVGLGLMPLAATAQTDYPNRPVKVIVPFGPGSVPEAVLRIFTTDMSSRFGQPFVIEHKPGASTNIAAGFVAAAPPDGYTLLMSNLASNALNKWTYKKLAYDPDAFTTAGMMATTAFYVVVRPDAPYATVQDLVNAANKSPLGFKYGSLVGLAE